jgi:hypothetical protein
MVNLDFKIALIRNFGSQTVASRRLKIQEAKLSHFVQGHDEPNERERKLLEKALGQDYFAKESQADERRGVMGILADQTGSLSTEPKKDFK